MATQDGGQNATDKRYRSYDEFERAIFPRTYRDRKKADRDRSETTAVSEIVKAFRKQVRS